MGNVDWIIIFHISPLNTNKCLNTSSDTSASLPLSSSPTLALLTDQLRLESASAPWVSSSPNSSWSRLCPSSWQVSSVSTAWSLLSLSSREVLFPQCSWRSLHRAVGICSFGLRPLLRLQFAGKKISIKAAGLSIGIVGDAGVRANAQQDKIFVGMILILIFGEALALYGLIVSLILTSQWLNTSTFVHFLSWIISPSNPSKLEIH